MPLNDDYSTFLINAQDISRRWLFDSALPLWWAQGADHHAGGYRESIGRNGISSGKAIRLRVQARQTFVYAQAGALGWTGPWQAAMRHGLTFMLANYRRPDGLFRSTLDTADQRVDLYDQAFTMLALAHAYEMEGRPAELLAIAQTLMQQIDATLRLEEGGYFDGLPHQAVLRSNPLMHLLEALLAWVAAGEEGLFKTNAIALCALAQTRMIPGGDGAMGECFNHDWSPMGTAQERIYEPGHQLEWAYLLLLSENLLGLKTREQALTLDKFARQHGIDPNRKVAVFSVDQNGAPLQRKARLWAQTERLRTSLVFAAQGLGDRAASQAAAIDSFATIQRFINLPVQGLWSDWIDEAGQFDDMPSPASSLYHLMTGLGELLVPFQMAKPFAHETSDCELDSQSGTTA